MPEKYVRVYESRWESLTAFEEALGECDPRDVTHEDHDCTDDSDPYMGPVDWAVDVLTNHGLTEPSSTVFTPNEWYTDPDGGHIVNYTTGAYEELSGHLHGFTDVECRAIWDRVTAGRYDRVAS